LDQYQIYGDVSATSDTKLSHFAKNWFHEIWGRFPYLSPFS
jgi:hypothetical protein